MRLRGPAPSGTGTRPQTRLSYTPDGLNRYGTIATVGGSTITPGYDSRGNLTAAGGPTYSYSSENLLTAASGGVSLSYDPATRLYQTSDGTTTTRFAYDGADMIAEYNGSSALQRRYVFDLATGSPLVWYEGTGTSDRRFLHEDERGSVIATSNSSGTMLSIDSYDEFGIPASTNTGRFGYTGQAWLPELGMYYYRNRMYSATMGRFMQADPIGFGGGMNLYAYVGNDPVNFTDPSGLVRDDADPPPDCMGDFCSPGENPPIIVTGNRYTCSGFAFCNSSPPDPFDTQGFLLYGTLEFATDAIGNGGVGDCNVPSSGTTFSTPQAAGVARARRAAQIQDEGGDSINEYGDRIVHLPGGGYTYTEPVTIGEPGKIQFVGLTTDSGWYHIHDINGGDMLSNGTSTNPGDRQMINVMLAYNVNFVSVLGARLGNRVYSWTGNHRISQRGRDEGELTCH